MNNILKAFIVILLFNIKTYSQTSDKLIIPKEFLGNWSNTGNTLEITKNHISLNNNIITNLYKTSKVISDSNILDKNYKTFEFSIDDKNQRRYYYIEIICDTLYFMHSNDKTKKETILYFYK